MLSSGRVEATSVDSLRCQDTLSCFFKIATTRIELLCCRQHKHKPVPMLGIAGNVSGPTECQRKWLNLMNILHGWYSLPRCHPLADLSSPVYISGQRCGFTNIWWRSPRSGTCPRGAAAFPSRFENSSRRRREKRDMESGGRRPGIEISALKHLWSPPVSSSHSYWLPQHFRQVSLFHSSTSPSSALQPHLSIFSLCVLLYQFFHLPSEASFAPLGQFIIYWNVYNDERNS